MRIDKEYYDNGRLMHRTPYDDDGKINGACMSWYEDGTLKRESHHVHGKLNGVSRSFHKDGSIALEKHFVMGVEVSKNQITIHQKIVSEPDRWFRSSDFFFLDDQRIVDETGGMIRWCSTCETDSSPNRPCFCGLWVVQRPDGMFLGDTERGRDMWVSDWRKDACHFDSKPEAFNLACILVSDQGPLELHKIGDRENKFNVVVSSSQSLVKVMSSENLLKWSAQLGQ